MTEISRVESILRRFHPTGEFEKIDVEHVDTHLRNGGLDRLLKELGQIEGVNVEVGEPDYDLYRSYPLYVGLVGAPSWFAFNREMSDERRASIVAGGPLAFWLISLSRLAPLWMSEWNEFVERNGRVTPILCDEPNFWEWKAAALAVRNRFREMGWVEIDRALLDLPVTWMNTNMAPTLVARGRSPHPTVRDTLFADCY